MNRYTNKRGRGRPPERKGVDLGRNTYIQEITSMAMSGSSSQVATMVRSHTRSGGKSVSQPELPPIVEVESGEDEVASRGSEELRIAIS